MKQRLLLMLGLAGACLGCFKAMAETNGAPAVKIGVYDSRAVAYAYLWSEPFQRKLKEQVAAARMAKEAGDTAKFRECDAMLRALQKQNHRQVFSTAPIDEILAGHKDRLAELEKQMGVKALISRWDDPRLQQYQDGEKVDVTDVLVREFIQPTENQAKTISGILKSKPLSLEKCDELIRKGQL